MNQDVKIAKIEEQIKSLANSIDRIAILVEKNEKKTTDQLEKLLIVVNSQREYIDAVKADLDARLVSQADRDREQDEKLREISEWRSRIMGRLALIGSLIMAVWSVLGDKISDAIFGGN